MSWGTTEYDELKEAFTGFNYHIKDMNPPFVDNAFDEMANISYEISAGNPDNLVNFTINNQYPHHYEAQLNKSYKEFSKRIDSDKLEDVYNDIHYIEKLTEGIKYIATQITKTKNIKAKLADFTFEYRDFDTENDDGNNGPVIKVPHPKYAVKLPELYKLRIKLGVRIINLLNDKKVAIEKYEKTKLREEEHIHTRLLKVFQSDFKVVSSVSYEYDKDKNTVREVSGDLIVFFNLIHLEKLFKKFKIKINNQILNREIPDLVKYISSLHYQYIKVESKLIDLEDIKATAPFEETISQAHKDENGVFHPVYIEIKEGDEHNHKIYYDCKKFNDIHEAIISFLEEKLEELNYEPQLFKKVKTTFNVEQLSCLFNQLDKVGVLLTHPKNKAGTKRDLAKIIISSFRTPGKDDLKESNTYNSFSKVPTQKDISELIKKLQEIIDNLNQL